MLTRLGANPYYHNLLTTDLLANPEGVKEVHLLGHMAVPSPCRMVLDLLSHIRHLLEQRVAAVRELQGQPPLLAIHLSERTIIYDTCIDRNPLPRSRPT